MTGQAGRTSAGFAAPMTLRAPRGLFVLRYASAGFSSPPPRIAIAPPDPAQGELLLPPGMSEPVLEAPGDGLVVRAATDLVLAYAVEAGAMPVLAMESVSNLVRSAPAIAAPRPLPAVASREQAGAVPFLHLNGRRGNGRSSAGDGVILLGHVARRGDLSAAAGDWLGAPDANDAIEGLELRWPSAPKDLDVSLKLTVNDHGRRTLPEVGLGMFTGTRRRAAPVVGIDIALEGRRADGWLVDCQAAFLGQDVLAARGMRIALRGKTGREPLVALRIRIGTEDSLQDDKGLIPAIAARSGAKAGRVRIFRPPA